MLDEADQRRDDLADAMRELSRDLRTSAQGKQRSWTDIGLSIITAILVSLVVGVLAVGGYAEKIKQHDRNLEQHDRQLERLEGRWNSHLQWHVDERP